MPTDDSPLETSYSEQDYTDVETKNNITVEQTATKQYAVHLFKDYVGTNSSVFVEWAGKTNIDTALSTLYLQVFNLNSNQWDTISSESVIGANTTITLAGSVPNLTNYKDGSSFISCRVYQLAI